MVLDEETKKLYLLFYIIMRNLKRVSPFSSVKGRLRCGLKV
jgi:hypothetical protein